MTTVPSPRRRLSRRAFALAAGALVTLAAGAAWASRQPATTIAACGDSWRAENASDCRVRLVLEAWERDPLEGEATLNRLTPGAEKDRVVWIVARAATKTTSAICRQIGDPHLRHECDALWRPWLHLRATKLPSP